MEKEFNFNGDSEIGTFVSKLKNIDNNKHTETDVDYDKIISNLNNNSETINNKTNFNYDSNNIYTSTITDVRPKKSINMSKIAKDIEFDLQKANTIQAYNYNEPLPINYSKNITKNSQLQKLEETINLTPPNLNVNQQKNNQIETSNILKKNKDIILNVLFFILLNNKFIIELVYDKIPFVKKYDSPYPNLLIRSTLFGLVIWSIKKFNI